MPSQSSHASDNELFSHSCFMVCVNANKSMLHESLLMFVNSNFKKSIYSIITPTYWYDYLHHVDNY